MGCQKYLLLLNMLGTNSGEDHCFSLNLNAAISVIIKDDTWHWPIIKS